MKLRQTWIAWGAYSLSAGAHGAFFIAPPSFDPPQAVRPEPTLVQFTVAEPEPEPLPPPVEEPPTPPKQKEIVEPQPQSEPEVAPAPPEVVDPAPPEPAEAPPPELTGTTLLSNGPGEFSAELGSGRSRTGPIVAGISRASPTVTPVTRAPSKPAVVERKPSPPPIEPLKNLLKRPTPPNLKDALERNYPAGARAQGKSGEAKVRARVDADGRIRVVRVMGESAPGFGASCASTLKESQWTPPISQNGTKVGTWIGYRCSFVARN